MFRRIALALCLSAYFVPPALGQVSSNTARRIISGTAAPPATCNAGPVDAYVRTGATSPGLYLCLSTNTWTASGVGGNTTSTVLTNNTVPKASGANSIVDSSIIDDGTTVNTPENTLVGTAVTNTGQFSGVPRFQVNANPSTQGNPIETHTSFAGGLDAYAHVTGNFNFRAPQIQFFKSRGTQAAPTATQSADRLLNFFVGGYDGTQYIANAGLTCNASENWTLGANGTQCSFSVVQNTTSAAIAGIRIGQDGFVGLGNIGVASPLFTLHTAPGFSVNLGAANAAPTDGNISGGALVPWLDQTNNILKFRIKYTDNSLHAANVPVDNGPATASTYSTSVNCANGASPAVCTSATSGAVAVPTGTNPTLQINTTNITANSRIFLQIDESLTIAATTCNTTLSTLVQPVVTARSVGASFTIQIGAIIATNPACVSWWIVNQ